MAGVSFEISLEDKNWRKALPGYKKIISDCTKTIAKHCNLNGEISILLTNDAAIRKLNKTYRDKDKPTNVLSFPQDEPGMLGDIAMALETLEREASEQEKSFADHFAHLYVHGVLHLLGHDHMTKSEQKTMEALEIKILIKLGIENPYI